MPNIALHRGVYASQDGENSVQPEVLVDGKPGKLGNINSKMFSYVNFFSQDTCFHLPMLPKPWVQVDFGTEHEVHAVRLDKRASKILNHFNNLT